MGPQEILSEPGSPHTVELSLDTQNYSEQQREKLSQAFRSHGFDAAAYSYERRTIEELAALVRIALDDLTIYAVYKLLDEAYQAWLRPVLKETLFRPRNRKEAPTLLIEAADAEAIIKVGSDSELAAALELLGEVLEPARPFLSERNVQFAYRDDGKWEVWPDVLEPIAYVYDPGAKTFTEIRK
jgi:hypothetical protein